MLGNQVDLGGIEREAEEIRHTIDLTSLKIYGIPKNTFRMDLIAQNLGIA